MNSQQHDSMIGRILAAGSVLVVLLALVGGGIISGHFRLNLQSGSSAGRTITATVASVPKTQPYPLPPGVQKPPMPLAPIPTAALPSIRAYPLPSVPSSPGPVVLQATARPQDPYTVKTVGQRAFNRHFLLQSATVAAIGTVKDIMPARWNTPNGDRPANPHASGGKASIYRPTVFEVEQYLKGAQPQTRLMLVKFGGAIGPDSVAWGMDDQYDFQVGQRIIVYLTKYQGTQYQGTQRNEPIWWLDGLYAIDPDGQIHNSYERLSLQQLITEAQQAK